MSTDDDYDDESSNDRLEIDLSNTNFVNEGGIKCGCGRGHENCSIINQKVPPEFLETNAINKTAELSNEENGKSNQSKNQFNNRANRSRLNIARKRIRFKRRKRKVKLQSIPWRRRRVRSRIDVLLQREWKDDSSGEDYIPHEDEEDDDDRISLPPSVSNENADQPTPLSDNSPETPQLDMEIDPNPSTENGLEIIALRTRSKLSLNETPLEVIENAFMPPDITADMYDMDCDDDIWADFIKTFTKPLEEVTKQPEDEEQDPEYDVTKDKEIEEDVENVQSIENLDENSNGPISSKNNNLISELLDFINFDRREKCTETQNNNKVQLEKENKNVESDVYIMNGEVYHVADAEIEIVDELSTSTKQEQIQEYGGSENIEDEYIFTEFQIDLLSQQLRQHVQLCTQHFILSYDHPKYSSYASTYREFLYQLKSEQKDKEASMYYIENLDNAIKLVENWKSLYDSDTEEIIKTKNFVLRVMVESVHARPTKVESELRFPPLIMDVISKSSVFLYLFLLPSVPYRVPPPSKSQFWRRYSFTRSERCLLTLCLDTFVKQSTKKFRTKKFCRYAQSVLFKHLNMLQIENLIRLECTRDPADSPVRYFYDNTKVPDDMTIPYIWPLNDYYCLPPCEKRPEELPLPWRTYLYPITCALKSWKTETTKSTPTLKPITAYRVQESPSSDISSLLILPSAEIGLNSTPKSLNKRKRNFELLNREINNWWDNIISNTMPDMPQIDISIKSESISDSTIDEENLQQNSTMIASPNENDVTNFAVIRENCNFSLNECQFNPSTSEDSKTLEKDNPDEINELMIASSTVKPAARKELSAADKKRAKLRREFIANLTMLSPDEPRVYYEKLDRFVLNYYNKLKRTLEDEEFKNIIDVLLNFDDNKDTMEFIAFYKEIQAILSPKYPELCEEFLLFLTKKQAQEVGGLISHFCMNDMFLFIDKLHEFFKDHPLQIKKITKCMLDLIDSQDLTMEKIRAAILPLLKGNTLLTEWFLQLFPCERPSKTLLDGPRENVNLKADLQQSNSRFEMIVLPETEDPYSGPNCICSCHNSEDVQASSRTIHCKTCGIRFIQGKVYIQTGKVFRSASVSFPSNPAENHTERLNAIPQRKRSDISPSKHVSSPTKESQDKFKEEKKTPRKRKNSVKISDNKVDEKTNELKNGSKTTKPRKKTISKVEKKGKNVKEVQKKLADDLNEDMKECDNDMAQCHAINTTDEDSNSEAPPAWSREEDRIILQTFQESSEEESFDYLLRLLPNRNRAEIKKRFQTLLSLLQEMASTSS